MITNPLYIRFKSRLVLFFMLSLLMLSCSERSVQQPEDAAAATTDDAIVLTSTQMQAAGLITGPLIDTVFAQTITLSGYLEVPPENRSLTGTYFAGKVVGIRVQTGQTVQRGAVLFDVENPEFVTLQQDYLAAADQAELLKKELERQSLLAKENIASQKDLQTITTQYQAAVVALSALKSKLDLLFIDEAKLTAETIRARIGIRSPIGGQVSEISIVNGQWLEPQMNAIEVIDKSVLQLRLQVFEKDLPMLAIGQSLHFAMPYQEQELVRGFIRQISPGMDMEKRITEVLASVSAPFPQALQPGMFVQATVATGQNRVRCLPAAAVAEADDKFYVLQQMDANATESRFRRVEVKPGETMGDLTQVVFSTAPEPKAKFLYGGVFQLIQTAE